MKINKLIVAFIASVMALGVAACGQEQVSDNSLEEARQLAKANSEYNAKLYRAANPRFTADYSLVGRSDDSQSKACPKGDGWAEWSIMKVDGKTVDKTVLMCSTYSASVGCYRKEDFDKNPNLAKQNSGCNSEVPWPLPKLGS